MRQWKSLSFGKSLGFAAALLALAGGPALAEEAGGGANGFLSRITVAAPFYTYHFPKDRMFNDHNWGGVMFFALDRHVALAGGDFLNSYRRNTAFAGISLTPWNLDLSGIALSPGGLIGVDLTHGYAHENPVEPLLGAATLKIGSAHLSDRFFDRVGLLATIIPGFGSNRSTAANLALTLRL